MAIQNPFTIEYSPESTTPSIQLQEGEYISLTADETSIIRSTVFPGLHLAVTALLNNDIAQVLTVLQHGLASKEYKKFVERLTQK